MPDQISPDSSPVGSVGVVDAPRPPQGPILGVNSTVPSGVGFGMSEVPAGAVVSPVSAPEPAPVVEVAPPASAPVEAVVPKVPEGFDLSKNAQVVADIVSRRAEEGISGTPPAPKEPLVSSNPWVTDSGIGITPRSAAAVTPIQPVSSAPTPEPSFVASQPEPVVQIPANPVQPEPVAQPQVSPQPVRGGVGGLFGFLRRK